MDQDLYTVRIPRRWARLALTVTVTVLVMAPLTAVATHTFNDVPSTHTFHDDITWLQAAGVTKGCNPPANTEYCPDEEVTRAQMAGFMKRLAENQVVDAATVQGMTAAELIGQTGPRGPTGPAGNANVTIYEGGAWNSAAFSAVTVNIPGISSAAMHASLWRVDLLGATGNVYHLPGTAAGTSDYRVYHAHANEIVSLVVVRTSGTGEAYDGIRVTRTAANNVVALSNSGVTTIELDTPPDR